MASGCAPCASCRDTSALRAGHVRLLMKPIRGHSLGCLERVIHYCHDSYIIYRYSNMVNHTCIIRARTHTRTPARTHARTYASAPPQAHSHARPHTCSRTQAHVGETGVSWDTFHFFSNITENMYDIGFELTRQGRGILPLQTLLISYLVTSFVTTEYGVNDTWSNCPNLPRHGVCWDSKRGT